MEEFQSKQSQLEELQKQLKESIISLESMQNSQTMVYPISSKTDPTRL